VASTGRRRRDFHAIAGERGRVNAKEKKTPEDERVGEGSSGDSGAASGAATIADVYASSGEGPRRAPCLKLPLGRHAVSQVRGEGGEREKHSEYTHR